MSQPCSGPFAVTLTEESGLSIEDITVDRHDGPSLVRIHLKSSKTDKLHRGVDVFIGATGNNLCPVTALMSYLAQRGGRKGPVFLDQNGRPLLKGVPRDVLAATSRRLAGE